MVATIETLTKKTQNYREIRERDYTGKTTIDETDVPRGSEGAFK